jgi:hypothetical protein
MVTYLSSTEQLRAEIAATAARMIAEDGVDYGTAKRKAVKQIIGNTKVRGEFMPNNEQIEDEVRLYNELFFSDTQPARLLDLRHLTLQLMQDLAPFSPYLTGAVLNGTAGEHSDIRLQLFTDSPKDVEIFLLNKHINFEVSETPHFNGRREPIETISFMWKNEGVHLAVHATNDLRGAIKPSAAGKIERADIDTVRDLINEAHTK